MANPDHLAKLKEGVEVWNQWRGEHPDIQPDLQEASLYEANLQKADLQQALFDAETNLRDVILGDGQHSEIPLHPQSESAIHLTVHAAPFD